MARNSAEGKELFTQADLQQRVITALVIGAMFLAVVLLSSLIWFEIIMAAVFMLAAWEWAGLSGAEASWKRWLNVLAMTLCMLLLHVQLSPSESSINFFVLANVIGLGIVFWLVVLVLVSLYPDGQSIWEPAPVLVLMGFLLLIPCWSGMVLLKQQDPSGMLILWVIGIIAVADIGAYFVGVRFGKHKLAPRLSPGKSWEGFVGGMAGNFLFALVIARALGTSLIETVWLVLAMLLVACSSVLGDLFESMIKRHRGVKDSGQLLPGHGGVLDRIDGWTAAVPVFVLTYLLAIVPYSAG